MPDRRAVRGALLLALGMAVPLLAQTTPQNSGSTPPKAKTGANGDVELVEKVLAARKDYQNALEQLRAHYVQGGDTERAKWAEEELIQYHRIIKQAYRLDLDVPPPTLKAAYNVPEANQLYIRAMSYKDKGSNLEYIDNQKRAEILLQEMLTKYPQSDKIGDAAFQLGDLYESKAFHQYPRAAAYYERCFQWHPNTHHDARIRAARLYDKVLQERSRAAELYKEILNTETDPKRLDEARKRLADLSQKK